MSLIPKLVDYSTMSFDKNKIPTQIYTRQEKLSIFITGILLITFAFSISFLYYRYTTKAEYDQTVTRNLANLNNLIYS